MFLLFQYILWYQTLFRMFLLNIVVKLEDRLLLTDLKIEYLLSWNLMKKLNCFPYLKNIYMFTNVSPQSIGHTFHSEQ